MERLPDEGGLEVTSLFRLVLIKYFVVLLWKHSKIKKNCLVTTITVTKRLIIENTSTVPNKIHLVMERTSRVQNNHLFAKNNSSGVQTFCCSKRASKFSFRSFRNFFLSEEN